MENAGELVREAASKLERFLASADVDPAVFDAAQVRLTGLLELTRKYGRTEAELVRLRDRLREQLDRLATDDELPASLVKDQERARELLAHADSATTRRIYRRGPERVRPLR